MCAKKKKIKQDRTKYLGHSTIQDNVVREACLTEWEKPKGNERSTFVEPSKEKC